MFRLTRLSSRRVSIFDESARGANRRQTFFLKLREQKMKFFQKLLKMFKTRNVLVHCENGDVVLKVHRGDIIHVPWMLSYCPFHLEKDGTVTLRLMWGCTKSKGYGKVWSGITWEEIKE